jgi:hypothetical protein
MVPLDEIETRYCRFVDEVINHRRLDRLGAARPRPWSRWAWSWCRC